MALCELDYVKELLGVTGTSEDTRLQIWIDSADRAIKHHCNREFELAAYTEFHTGTNAPRLALRHYPVTAITGVWLDHRGYFGTGEDAFSSLTQLVEGKDFVLDRGHGGTPISQTGILYRLHSVWPMIARARAPYRLAREWGSDWGNIKVTYTAGYSPIPADLSYACATLVAQMRRTFVLGGTQIESERIGDYSYKLALGCLDSVDLASTRSLIALYKSLPW